MAFTPPPLSSLEEDTGFTPPPIDSLEEEPEQQPKGFLEGVAESLEPSRQAANKIASDVAGSVVRGATSENINMAAEGLYRGGASTVANVNPLESLQKKKSDYQQGLVNLDESVKARGFATPDDDVARRGIEQEIQNTDLEISKFQVPGSTEQLSQSPAGQQFRKNTAQFLEMSADEAHRERESIREAFPVSEEFQRSIPGQVIQGVSQLSSLPAYAVPGLGQIMAVGQLYQEGYDDAIQSGATPEQADDAAKKYVSISAPLEIIADKLLVGKALRAMEGKVTVGQAIKEVAKQFAQEGSTEGAQQLWLNTVQRELTKIDPNRPFDQDVATSVLVGGLVGGISAVGAQGVGVLSQKEDTKLQVKDSIKREAQEKILATTNAVADATQDITPYSAEALRKKGQQKAIEAGQKIDEKLDEAERKLREQEDKEKEAALKDLQDSIKKDEESQEATFAPPATEPAPSTTEVPISEELVQEPTSDLPSVETGTESPELAAPALSEQQAARARIEQAVATGQTPAPEDIALAEAVIEPAQDTVEGASSEITPDQIKALRGSRWTDQQIQKMQPWQASNILNEGMIGPQRAASDIRSAVRLPDGTVVTGELGQTHRDVLMGLDPEIADSLEVKDIGYSDSVTGEFLSESQAVKSLPKFGVSLQQLQEAGERAEQDIGGELESRRGGMASEELIRLQKDLGLLENENPPIQQDQPNVPEGATPATADIQPAATAVSESVAEVVPKRKRIQLRTGPQSFVVEEKLPQSDLEREQGEQFYRVTNERTGASEIVEERDIAREIRPKSERVQKKVKSLPPKQQKKAEAATELDTTEDPYQGTPLTDASPLEVDDNLPLIDELSELGVFDGDSTGQTVLKKIADSKAPQWQKTLAARLLALNVPLQIEMVNRPDSTWFGLYVGGDSPKMLVNLARKNLGVPEVVLHESAHRATIEQIRNPQSLKGEAKAAYDELAKIFSDISSRPEFQGEYGASSVEEMVAEAFSNAGFRAKLDRIPSGKQTLWTKLVNAIARLLFNKPVATTSLLQQTIDNAFTLAGAPVIESRSNGSAAMAESGSWSKVIGNPNASDTAETKALVEATQELDSETDVDLTPLTSAQQQLLQETDTFKPLGLTAFFARQFNNIPGTDFNDRQSEAVQGLVKAAKSYNPESGVPFFKYASGVIRNHMRDYAKSRKVRNKYVKQDSPVMEDDDTETIVSTAPSPQDITIQENDRKRIQAKASEALKAVMAQASERDQKILAGYASGQTLREVGAEVNMSAEGVKKVLSRYRENVEKALFLRGLDISEILAPVDEATEPAVPTRQTTIEDESTFRESTVGRIERNDTARSEPLYGDESSPEEIAEAVFASRNMPDLSGQGMVPTSGSEQQEAFRDQIQPFLTGYWPDDTAERTRILKDQRAKWLAQPGIRNFLGGGLVELSEVSDNETSRLRFDNTPYRLEIGGANLISTAIRPDVSEVEAKSSVSQEINEEIIHAAHIAWLQKQWEKGGREGSFTQYVENNANNTLRDIVDTASTLPVQDAQQVVNALAGSVKLYVPSFRGMDLRTVSQVMMTSTPDQKARFINEFIRQIVQLRATDQITETSAVTILEKIGRWVADVLKSLRWAVRNIDGFGQQFASQIHGAEDILGSTFAPKQQGIVAPMAERDPEPSAAEKEVQQQIQKALLENKDKGKTDVRDDPSLLAPDMVPTQVMGQKFTVEGRQRLDSAYQKEAIDHAKAIFDEAGLNVVPNDFVDSAGQARSTWKLADDFDQQEEQGQKLLELLKRELANQDKEGAKPLSVLIDSIRGNMRETEAFTQSLRQQLFSNSQSYASMLGVKLRALAGIGKSLTDAVTHMPVYLNRIYSDAFNGEAIDSVLQKFRENLKEIFGNEEVDKFLQNETAFQEALEKLLKQAKVKDTGSKKGLLPTIKDILNDILTTPFYNQEDIYKRFKDRLEQEFNISPEISTKAQKFLKLAFERKFRTAKERALEKARKSLSPAEKKAVGSSKSPLWQKIVEATNAGFFDAPAVLQNLAERSGWKIPTAEQIEKLKQLAGEEQKMRELTDEEKAAIGDDPEKLERARKEKAAATLNKRAAIKKKMQEEWAKFATPQGHIFSKAGWGLDARKQRARMLNEFASANLLFTPAFAVKQVIDVGTQMALHLPTRAIASAVMNRKTDLSNNNPTRLVQDSMEAIGDGFKNQLSALKVLGSTLKQTLKGKTEARNVDALFSSTSVFDRLEQDADRLWKRGDPTGKVTAVAMKVLGIIRMSYRFAQALDMMQGNQTEAQEMYEQTIQQLRENGMDPAEARRNAQEVMGDTKAEWLDALARAKNIFDTNGIEASPADIQVAAWEIVKSRQYYRMATLGLDAEANQQANFLLKNTLGWNESEDGGIGSIAAATAKSARKFGENVGLPVPFALFGNAIATGINRALTTHGLGLFPSAFKGSPWFAGEKNQAQRKIEASIGLTVVPFLFALAAAGMLRVRNWWPEDEEEKQTFEREGHRPGTVEINLGEGRFIPISMSSGPMQFVRGWLAGIGAVQDASEKNEKRKKRAMERAGDSDLKYEDPTNGDFANIAATAAISTLLQGRTAGGLGAQFSDQGSFSVKKVVPGLLTPSIPFLPGVNQVQRMRGANIDPKKADLTQLLFPSPNSTAQRTNSLGDSVSNPNAVQRISQMLTGGTYLGIVDEKTQMQQKPYDLIYKAGWVPPPMNQGQFRNIGRDFRPFTPEETANYYKSYGNAFRADVAKVPESLPPEALQERLQDAHQRSRDKALRDVGVEVD